MVLRKINFVLAILVALVGLYLAFAPLYPSASLWIRTLLADERDGYKYASQLATNAGLTDLPPAPKGNRLVIPQILVDGEIHEGTSPFTLDQGIWHRPLSSTPAEGGNTVLAAHRYLYSSGPNTFYSLDKLAIGDEFYLMWEDKEYDYKVTSIREVPPTAIEIEAPTDANIVTLYTCTPLWSAKNRLVVVAELTNQEVLQ